MCQNCWATDDHATSKCNERDRKGPFCRKCAEPGHWANQRILEDEEAAEKIARGTIEDIRRGERESEGATSSSSKGEAKPHAGSLTREPRGCANCGKTEHRTEQCGRLTPDEEEDLPQGSAPKRLPPKLDASNQTHQLGESEERNKNEKPGTHCCRKT